MELMGLTQLKQVPKNNYYVKMQNKKISSGTPLLSLNKSSSSNTEPSLGKAFTLFIPAGGGTTLGSSNKE